MATLDLPAQASGSAECDPMSSLMLHRQTRKRKGLRPLSTITCLTICNSALS